MLNRIFKTFSALSKASSYYPQIQFFSTYTVRTVNTDVLGHGNFSNAFQSFALYELYRKLESCGILPAEVALHQDGISHDKKLLQHNPKSHSLNPQLPEGKRHFRVLVESNKYMKEIYWGDQIQVDINVVGVSQAKGQIFLKKMLSRKTAQKVDIASMGYYVLQKYENDSRCSLSEEETIQLEKQLAFSENEMSPAFFHLCYLSSPDKVIGKEIPLSINENIIQKDHSDNGVVKFHKLFENIHTYCHEKGIFENSGMKAKGNILPVMTNSQLVTYGNLRAGEQYRVFLYVEKENNSTIQNSRYTWIGTITNMNNEIVAIVRCQDILLLNKHPVTDISTLDQEFIELLNSYAIESTIGYSCVNQIANHFKILMAKKPNSIEKHIEGMKLCL